MPVHNGERYMREAIESILVQTFTNFEFLVVDNGSTDDSVEIARSYADPRVRVLTEPQPGLVPALNRGIAEARGQYIARMDADDVSVPQRLMRQVDYTRRHPNTAMVGTWAQVIDGSGTLMDRRLALPTHGKALHVALCIVNSFVHGS